MSKTVGIAGMGWLGLPLAQNLLVLGYQIKGSVTSRAKATTLQAKGFEVYPLEISETGVRGEPQGFLKDVDSLIVMIPPGLRRNTGADYVLKMAHFLTEIKKSSIKKIVLVSSTSVYDDLQGHVTEKDIPKPTSQAGKQLVQVEQLFFNSEGIKTTIVRFGGLFGGSRQPVRYLAGRKNLNDGNAPVNLIHRQDCIGILSEIIKQEAYGYIFNATSPEHPRKRIHYTKRATALNLTPPLFSEEHTEQNYKQVDSVNIADVLNYSFKNSL
jgi:nucleoside-diphosphate-sugar epimerase